MNRLQLAALLQQPFCIMPDYGQAMLPVIASILDGSATKEDFSEARASMIPMMIGPDGTGKSWNTNDAAANSIMVLTLKGPVLKDSQMCGPIGTVELAAKIIEAKVNPNIIGCVLVIESGGGAVYAVKPLADAITAFKANKPIIALAEDTMCSAAYYIASYATEIFADNPKTQIGSIGTMISFQDIQPALEKQGVVFHEIYATKSTAKNKVFKDANAGDYSAIINKMLDPINEDFIGAVKQNRLGTISTSEKLIYQGETWFASIAKELGMIDTLGNLEDAVARIKELSINSNQPSNQTINMNFQNLMNLAGIENPSQEQIDLANAELTVSGITAATIVAESFISEAANAQALVEAANLNVTNLTTLLASKEDDLTIANCQIVELKSKVDAFGENAGALHSSTTSQNEIQPDAVDKDLELMMDNLPHNRAADALN